MKYPTGLSENEWYIMQVLWDHAPASLREICEALEPVKGWSRHAVTSFLKRMLEKGAVSVDESGKVRTYSRYGAEKRRSGRRRTPSWNGCITEICC